MIVFIIFGLLVASLIIVTYIFLFFIALYLYIRVKIVREKAAQNPEAEPVFN